MFDKVLPGNTKKYLALLEKGRILPPKTYLAGGTAVALQLGHRLSFDLDFFTPQKFKVEEVLRKLEKIEGFKIERTARGTILGSLPEVKFSLFYYQYPLIEKSLNYLGIKIASLKDLAATKIGAISSRGTRRDFIDIYYLLKTDSVGDLRESLELYQKRFRNLASIKFHILKSLTYFEDADKEKDPKMLDKDYSWSKVKKFLASEIRKLI